MPAVTVRSVIRGSAALLAVSAVLLAGCSSDEPAPRTLPPVGSSSAQPSKPSPTASAASAIPADARGATSEAASKFARHYMKSIEVAFATGDPAHLKDLSSTSCAGCQNFIAAVIEAAADGHVAREAQIVVGFAVSPALQSNSTTVDLRYERLPGSVVDRAGRIVSSIPGQESTDVQLTVTHDGSWSVEAFASVDAAQ